VTRAFAYASLIALDAGGVDLSREGHRSEGVISIVQLATHQQSQCFILDVPGKGLDDLLVVWLLAVLPAGKTPDDVVFYLFLQKQKIHHKIILRSVLIPRIFVLGNTIAEEALS
jgi:hypothetical protein